jgi:arginine decarboxylase
MKMNDLPELAVQTLRPLTIHLFAATAQGPTAQAAFDAALRGAGVVEAERLRASSLIPPHARLVWADRRATPRPGGRLRYVVMSQMQQSRPGEFAHAGLGWVQRADDGRGLFIDLHHEVRERLEHDLHATFGAIASLRDPAYRPVQTAFASRRCDGLPVCALIVAACACEAW